MFGFIWLHDVTFLTSSDKLLIMYCQRFLSIIVILWQIVSYSAKDIISENKLPIIESGKPCSVGQIFSCETGETCLQDSINSTFGRCVCKVNFTRSAASEPCLQTKPKDIKNDFSTGVSVSAIAVGLLVPVFSLVIIGGLILIARRYRCIHRFREQSHQLSVASYDTVLIDQSNG